MGRKVAVEAGVERHLQSGRTALRQHLPGTGNGRHRGGGIAAPQLVAETLVSALHARFDMVEARQELPKRLTLGGAAHGRQLLGRDRDALALQRRGKGVRHRVAGLHGGADQVEHDQRRRAHDATVPVQSGQAPASPKIFGRRRVVAPRARPGGRALDAETFKQQVRQPRRQQAAFLGAKRLLASRPGEAVGEARIDRRLAPRPRRIGRSRTAPDEVQVQHAVRRGRLRARRRRRGIERPVAGVPVVHAAALELRQHVEHRASGRRHQKRPLGQFGGVERGPVPDAAWRVNDELPAVAPVDHDGRGVGQRHGAPAPTKEHV